MAKGEFSVPALMKRLTSESAAYELLEQLRWNGEPVCPHCGVIGGHYFLKPANTVNRKTRTGSRSERRVWKCKACRRQFTVLVGTPLHGSKIPVRTWVLVIAEMCASKNGVSPREIERKYDLTAKTALFMCHRIREAVKRDPLAGLLSGTVMADESWIGGKLGNKPKHVRAQIHPWDKSDRSRNGTNDKPIVMALVNHESGEVRSRIIPNVQGATLREAIAEEVEIGAATLVTDEWAGYRLLAGEVKSHETVNHSRDEYVNRRGMSTNAVEGFFSQLKRSIDGTHHAVSREHLPRYLAQHDFLRSTYKLNDSDRMRVLMGQTAGRRLTYKPLTERS